MKKDNEGGFRVLEVTEGLSSSLGGTSVAVSQLVNHLAGNGIDVALFSLSKSIEEDRLIRLHPKVQLSEFDVRWLPRMGWCAALRNALASMPPPDLAHIHGLWRLYYAQVAHYARKRGIPVVVSVHGMLEPWALAHTGGLKRLARALYQDAMLNTAACLHATADQEAGNLRRLGFRRPIAVIPWGIEAPLSGEARPSGDGLDLALPAGKRVALFLSRIHPKKALDVLFHAWSRLCSESHDWILVVAGDGEPSYLAELRRLAASLGIETVVVFSGLVRDARKEKLFSAAELFVFPSHSENFGLVVAEAMARGVPVIASEGTPWPILTERGCGWWVKLGVDPLAAALRQALSKTPDQLRAMGVIGRECIMESFRSEESGRAMIGLYRWVIGRGPRPVCVREEAGDVNMARTYDGMVAMEERIS